MNTILERIKLAYHLETDAELANFLDINASTLSMQKNRGRLNLKLIIQKCRDLNKNWLFHGKGHMWNHNAESARQIRIPIYKTLHLPHKGRLQRRQGKEVGWLTAEGNVLEEITCAIVLKRFAGISHLGSSGAAQTDQKRYRHY